LSAFALINASLHACVFVLTTHFLVHLCLLMHALDFILRTCWVAFCQLLDLRVQFSEFGRSGPSHRASLRNASVMDQW